MNAPASAPARIGKYEIMTTLGAGAMGVVYLAYDPNIDRKVALKTIRKDLLDGRHAATLAARFRQEAIAAGRLSHPGIVAVYDYGEDDSSAFIVMEYAPGEDLGAYAHARSLGFSEVGALMAELLDALQYAHDAGVVHRDIKPSNLIISAAGRLKITDFGIARLATSNLTQNGAAIGTPSYMAPEQYAGEPADHRADLFAAGVLFYELLTRRLPFDGDTIQHVAYQICHVEPTPPSALVPHLPPGLDAIVAQALAKSRDARFRSARELAAAIADRIGGGVQRVAGAASPGGGPAFAPAAPPVLASGHAGGYPQTPGTRTLAGPLAWAPETLRALEAALAPAVGALAGPLVRRSAAKTADPEQLAALLGASVDDPAARASLVRSLRVVLGAPPQAASATAASPPAGGWRAAMGSAPSPPPRTIGEQMRSFTQADLDRLTQVLAGFIGPIAKILVQKASAGAGSYRELCVRVSERLATPEERARFLAQVDAG